MGFKDLQQRHQLQYFSEQVNQSTLAERKGRAQPHWLSETAAASGNNFYSDYSVFEFAKAKRGKKSNTPEWFLDTLRSQHIPYNFFVPLKQEKELVKQVLGSLTDLTIKEVDEIHIEYPDRKSNPLLDSTSFDVFIDFITVDGKRGFFGIEVKYTEGAYSIGPREKAEIEKLNSNYRVVTQQSKMFMDDSDVLTRVGVNEFRQIWRNHMLAFSYAQKHGYDEYKSITLYHEGNSHFVKAIKGYSNLLSESGKKTIMGITYKDFISTAEKQCENERQKRWLNYLKERYNVV